MHTASGTAPLTTVIVTAAGATQDQLVRCLRGVLLTTPPRTRVLAAVPASCGLPRDLNRRVRLLAVRGGDATPAIAAEVAELQRVVVVPAGSTASTRGWLEEADLRWSRQPKLTGVVQGDGAHAFFFPVGATSVDGPQGPWSALPGLQVGGSVSDARLQDDAPRATDITAVLIVKDEERVLGRCLEAVSRFVDDVVVYDTGSTDGTRVVAAAAGARVVEGYWDSDFGAARNRAIEHATTEWVLIVDADEVAVGSPDDLRAHLGLAGVDAFRIEQLSTAHDSTLEGQRVMTTRIFRRERARYEGALHEQVVPRAGAGALRSHSSSPDVQLIHSGYRVDALAEKDKQKRNTEIARAAYLEAGDGSPAQAELASAYGRSLAMAGEAGAALSVLNGLLDAPSSPGGMVQAGRVAVPMLLVGSDAQDDTVPDELDRWLTALSAAGESPGQLALWRASALVGSGHTDRARQLLVPLLEDGAGGEDLWGLPFDPGAAAILLAGIDAADGDTGAAAARVRAELLRAPETVPLQPLFDALGAVGWTVRDLVRQAPPAFLERALRDMQLVEPRVALHWFAEHRALLPDDVRPVVAGCTVASRCDWRTALEWSIAAREHGLLGVCPLGELASQDGRDPHERALALALIGEGFGDDSALRRLLDLLEDLPGEQCASVLQVLAAHVPAVVDRLGALPRRAPA